MYKVFLTMGIIAMAVVLSACTSPAEKVAETAVEQSTNGEADVDFDNDTVTINTNGATFQAGESVSLPDGFPTDVHVADGTITAATTVDENNGYSVSIQTDVPVSQLKGEYESAMADDGWNVLASLDMGDTVSMSGEKDNRMMTVGISEADGITIIILTTGDSE
ncbi:MAG: hypothetical protein ACOYUK_03430 [Patescibacteria group bacterium]